MLEFGTKSKVKVPCGILIVFDQKYRNFAAYAGRNWITSRLNLTDDFVDFSVQTNFMEIKI